MLNLPKKLEDLIKNFKDKTSEEVINECVNVWGNLNDDEKYTLANIMSGKRYQNEFITLIDRICN